MTGRLGCRLRQAKTRIAASSKCQHHTRPKRVSSSTALTARTLAVADPSAKRVWMVQGAESFAQAIARGFLRGLIGLGLYGGGASQFPTGVDRVIVQSSRSYAYDSSSGTLYRFSKSKSTVVSKNVAPEGFAVGPGAVYVWDDAVRRLQRFAEQ